MAHWTKRYLQDANWRYPLSNTSFDAAGLIALADLNTIAKRTALTGAAVYADAFVLCPGIHKQQAASDLNHSEFPPTAALTTGYVFRVENQATVAYMQSVGIAGSLVNLTVEREIRRGIRGLWADLSGPDDSIVAIILLAAMRILTIFSVIFLFLIEDWWGAALLLALIAARLFNIFLIRQRASPGWHGAPEPGVMGDLLILLSQDRWIRLKGTVDSIKTVNSGQWLRGELTFFESSLQAMATMIVYIGAALASNATQSGKIIFIALLLVSAFFLAICNHETKHLHMHGHIIKPVGVPKAYKRRLDLAKELIVETKRDDWAVGLGMIKAQDSMSGVPGAVTL